jgi:hypothetical protein
LCVQANAGTGALDNGAIWRRLPSHKQRNPDDSFIANDGDFGRGAAQADVLWRTRQGGRPPPANEVRLRNPPHRPRQPPTVMSKCGRPRCGFQLPHNRHFRNSIQGLGYNFLSLKTATGSLSMILFEGKSSWGNAAYTSHSPIASGIVRESICPLVSERLI